MVIYPFHNEGLLQTSSVPVKAYYYTVTLYKYFIKMRLTLDVKFIFAPYDAINLPHLNNINSDQRLVCF